MEESSKLTFNEVKELEKKLDVYYKQLRISHMLDMAYSFDCDESHKQNIEEIIGKPASDELCHLMTHNVAKFKNFEYFFYSTRITSIRNQIELVRSSLNGAIPLLRPSVLTECGLWMIEREEEENIKLGRFAILASSILQDLLQAINDVEVNLPKETKGNRNKKEITMYQSMLVARIHQQVKIIYDGESWGANIKKAKIREATSKLLLLVNITPPGVNLEDDPARDRFNNSIKYGYTLLKNKEALQLEAMVLNLQKCY